MSSIPPYETLDVFERSGPMFNTGSLLIAHLEPGQAGPILEVRDLHDTGVSKGIVTPFPIPSQVKLLRDWQFVVIEDVARDFNHPVLAETGDYLQSESTRQPVWQLQPQYMPPAAVVKLAEVYGWAVKPQQLIRCVSRALHEASLEPASVKLGRLTVQESFEGFGLRLLNVEPDGSAIQELVSWQRILYMKETYKGDFTLVTPFGEAVLNGSQASFLEALRMVSRGLGESAHPEEETSSVADPQSFASER